MTDEEFLAFVGPAAMEIEEKRGYPAEAVMAQVHLESGGLSAYPAGSNNVLGIKWNGKGEFVEAQTSEFKGGWISVPAKWQKFASVYDCLESWADLMDQPWYAQAQPFKVNWAAFLALIWHTGEQTVYATDPMYLWKAVKRAAEVGIPQWCAAYRAAKAAPKPPQPVKVFIGCHQLDGNFYNPGSTVHGPLRPLLDEMKEQGYTFTYDSAADELHISRPKSRPAPVVAGGGPGRVV